MAKSKQKASYSKGKGGKGKAMPCEGSMSPNAKGKYTPSTGTGKF